VPLFVIGELENRAGERASRHQSLREKEKERERERERERTALERCSPDFAVIAAQARDCTYKIYVRDNAMLYSSWKNIRIGPLVIKPETDIARYVFHAA